MKPPINMYEAEERLRWATTEIRIVETIRMDYKRLHRKTHDITLLPNLGRLTNRMQAVRKEIDMIKAWVAARGFKSVRS